MEIKEIRDALKRHSNTIVVVGALVIFATYITREELREDFRDISDSIRNARTNFSNHRDADTILYQIDYLSMIDNMIEQQVLTQQNPSTTYEQELTSVKTRILGVKAGAHSLQSDLDSVSRLLAYLPEEEITSTKIAELNKDIDTLIGQSDENTTSVGKDGPPGRINTGSDAQNYIQLLISDKLDPLLDRIRGFSAREIKLQSDVIASAEEIQKSAEMRYELSNRASIVLFIIGWCLALVARLAGVGEIEDS